MNVHTEKAIRHAIDPIFHYSYWKNYSKTHMDLYYWHFKFYKVEVEIDSNVKKGLDFI